MFVAEKPGYLLERHDTDAVPQYEVWGGNFSLWNSTLCCDPGSAGYTYLGVGTGTAAFSGNFAYYIILAPESRMSARIDAIQGQGGYTGFYAPDLPPTGYGNVLAPENVHTTGEPDSQYAILNWNEVTDADHAAAVH